MSLSKYVKGLSLPVLIVIVCLILFLTGAVFDLLPSEQIIIKKTFLVAWWYLLSYTFRKLRLGGIVWNDEDKKYYYFVLLLGSAIIFALA